MAKHETAPINDISRISAGTRMKGTLISNSDIRIDGVFEGDLVTSGKLVMGEKAVLKGTIFCANADMWGSIEGDLYIGDVVAFKSTASFKGNLKTLKLCMETGVRFSGNCEIISAEEFKTRFDEFVNKQESAS